MTRLWRRLFWLIGIFSILFMTLLGRLAYIQLVGTESYSKHRVNLIKKAVQQRQQQFVLHSGRGEIMDRHDQAFTGKTIYALVLFPLIQSSLAEKKISQLAQRLSIPEQELIKQMEQIQEPKIFKQGHNILKLSEEEANQINELAIPGVLGLPFELRYDSEHQLAQHAIGYIGENTEFLKQYYAQELAQGLLRENSPIGVSGLEKTFQPFLQGLGPAALSYYVDARGFPMAGMGIRYTQQDNPFYPLILRTTLDMELQEIVEEALDRHVVTEGSVVVQEIHSSELLAFASRPNYMNQLDQMAAWENKALKRYPPGSIFKIVIAAAALEAGVVTPQRQFECHGVVEGTNFHCWKSGGHGSLTFAEAFAQSCNVVFGRTAQELGAEAIEEYAARLGLLEPNGWHTPSLFHLQDFNQLDGEEVGQVFAQNRTADDKNDKQYLLQTGIGQLDVQVTPLAVANLLATIAKGGYYEQVKLVKDILYQTGAAFHHFADNKKNRVMTPYTAYQLQRLLAGVLDHGTAKKLNKKEWKAAGKTGTAQAINSQGGSKIEKNHQWFAAYYPRENPKYSIVILALNQSPYSSNKPMDIFAEIVDWLDQKN